MIKIVGFKLLVSTCLLVYFPPLSEGIRFDLQNLVFCPCSFICELYFINYFKPNSFSICSNDFPLVSGIHIFTKTKAKILKTPKIPNK